MAVNQENTMKDVFVDCLSQQISEYELLKSMYPDQGEIVLNDKYIIDEINNFIDNKTEFIPSNLDFKLNVSINSLKIELFINLPRCYPKEEPDIYVSCSQLNRHNESRLNSELSDFIKETHMGEVCLYTAVSWLQENVDKFTAITQEPISGDINNEPQLEEDEFARLWIYSHHIYDKRKKDEIVTKAKDLNLTGFCLPGKPGIVCIEGRHSDCKEWWKEIKSMNWKKIVIRKTEIFKANEERNYKKFSHFREIKLNLSDLAKYMSELGLSHIFNEIFGLCNDDCH